MATSPRASAVARSDGSGDLTRIEQFASQHVAPRNVDIWCPPAGPRYPVIYMHDGQNLFDPGLANTGIDWGADEAITRLMRDEGLPGAIVVGIWCTELRRREYMPRAPLSGAASPAPLAEFAERFGGPPLSDAYLRFVTQELKPLVDASFPTLPDRQHTFVAGSSMGGLISLYALSEYPAIFGGAACLSTHWPIGRELLVDQMGRRLPRAGAHRLYFDYGTAGLDAEYEPYQLRMDGHLRAAGYSQGTDWLTRRYDGATHNEAAWRARLDLPLRFLLS